MWEDILMKRGGSINSGAKRLVDQVIDETPRNFEQILDLMFKELERSRVKGLVSGKNLIPTRQELKHYLAKNYNRVRISRVTGKETRGRSNSEMRYFR
tara:strand:+ start:225 stop:518 length:294 start_codon:yes stop_codon:yes gene_type:complete